VTGAGAEFVGGREVESGGDQEIREVFSRNIACPGRVVTGRAGDVEGDGVVRLGPDG
jgi:hypothetical protein